MKRIFILVTFVLYGLSATSRAAADCQLVTNARVEDVEGLGVMNVNGELPRLVTVEGAFRTAISPVPVPQIFWPLIPTAKIASVNLDGNNPGVVGSVDLIGWGIASDDNYLYIAEGPGFYPNIAEGKILRMRKDGSELTTIVPVTDATNSIVVGPDHKLYWINVKLIGSSRYEGKLFRANTDGSEVMEIADLNSLSAQYGEFQGSSQPVDLAIDHQRNKIYVADQISVGVGGQANRVIWQLDLDGSNGVRLGGFPGCTGPICETCPTCAIVNIGEIGIDSGLNNLYYRKESATGERGVHKLSLNSEFSDIDGITLPITAGLTPLRFLNQDYGVCNPTGTLSGTAYADIAVWRPSEGNWYVRSNEQDPMAQSSYGVLQHGLPGDIPLTLNFNGDNQADLTVWRPSEGNWYLCDWKSSTGCQATQVIQFGLPGDTPSSADFDGDGTDDLAVWRPSEGNWYLRLSNSYTTAIQQWGLPGDVPLTADLNSDERSDLVVWRPTEGNWYVAYSVYGADTAIDPPTLVRQWGLPGDRPLVADYDGDSKPDLAVWRPASGTWYICSASSGFDCQGAGVSRQFGLPGDIPLAGDFDGDAEADLAVWRPSEGNWYYRSSLHQTTVVQQWGLPGDVPIKRSPYELTLGK